MKFIKSNLFSYTLEDVRDSINRYLERNVINSSDYKISSVNDIEKILLDLRVLVDNAIERGADIDEDDIASAMIKCKKILMPNAFRQICIDIFNPLYETIGKNVPTPKAENDKGDFTQDEIDDLYEGIVRVGDDRFYKWLMKKFDWINDSNVNSIDLEPFMLQWIYETPNIYEEMREWLDEWKNEELESSFVVKRNKDGKYLGWSGVNTTWVDKKENATTFDSKEYIEKYKDNLMGIVGLNDEFTIVESSYKGGNEMKTIKSARTFDDVELQILFDNIVGGSDESFFEWYSENYGEIPFDNMKSIPKERIAEYVNSDPILLEDMEDEIKLMYDDYSSGNTLDKNINDYLKSSRKAIKSAKGKSDKFERETIISELQDTVEYFCGLFEEQGELKGIALKDLKNAIERLEVFNAIGFIYQWGVEVLNKCGVNYKGIKSSRKAIKSSLKGEAMTTKLFRFIQDLYYVHYITEEQLNKFQKHNFSKKEIEVLEENYEIYKTSNEFSEINNAIKSTINMINSF